ncbi:VOC family protein [Actinocorallia populi]|uniref:VOC family protein n=1 Tax=Actinocorallia populi TaxID=2079200 RepID=UPI000D08FACB|nr:VOC family protein [Actinocorallia populi]
MVTLPFPNRNFMQMCWVVPDLRAAIDSWVRAAGVGPFFWFDGVPCTDGRYRGRPAEFPAVTAAIAYAGDLQIELVCQDDDEPSIFSELVPRGRSGLHHAGLVCRDYETERDTYIEAGATLAFEGVIGTSRTCWLDTSPTLGFMIELLEPSATRDAGFAAMRKAADIWDGTDPIVGLS